MTVYELSSEQLAELKQNFLCEHNEETGETTYMSDLMDADEIVSDELLFHAYEGTDFSADDFFCTADL